MSQQQIEFMAWVQADAQRKVRTLTKTEHEVLVLLANGLTVNEVAKHTRGNANTVAGHRATIYSKLDVHSVAEAAVIACKAGLV